MNKQQLIKLLKSKKVRQILDNLNIVHLYLVWSYSRWDNKINSDVDLVYERKDNVRIWWLDFIKNKLILESIFNKKIDLVNEKYIYKDIKSLVEKDKILIY